MRIPGRALAVAMLLLLGTAAAEEQGAVRACIIDQPPWGDSTRPAHGIYVDVLAAVAKRLPISIGASPAPLARTLFEVESGTCDFTITSWTKDRSARLARGATLADLDYGLYLPRDSTVRGYPDLKGLVVAVPVGLSIGEPFDHDQTIQKASVYGYEQGLGMVEEHHADAALGSLITLRRFVRLRGTADRYAAPLVLAKVPLAVQMNRLFALEPVAEKLNGAVTALRESGEADRIIARHFEMDEE